MVVTGDNMGVHSTEFVLTVGTYVLRLIVAIHIYRHLPVRKKRTSSHAPLN